MSSAYANRFLKLKCAPDVLAATTPIGQDPVKEISEAMGIIQKVKPIVFDEPMKYNVVDLCSGNALVPVIAVHLLPITDASAVDKRERKRRWELVSRFVYYTKDIMDDSVFDLINENTILTSVHCCSDLALRVAEIYTRSKACALVMSPCCSGRMPGFVPEAVKKLLGGYITWAYYLSTLADGHLYTDKFILSPANTVIVARKKIEVAPKPKPSIPRWDDGEGD